MVLDLDLLDQALRGAAGQVDGVDLETIQPADAEAVTVEVFARWLHDQLSGALGKPPGVTLAVRVWESPLASAATRRRGESGRTTVGPSRGRAVADRTRGRATSCPRAAPGPLHWPWRAGRCCAVCTGADTSSGVPLHPGRQPGPGVRRSSTRRSSSSCTGAASRALNPSCCLGGGRSCRNSRSVLELGSNVGYRGAGRSGRPGRSVCRSGAPPRLRRDLPDAPRPKRRDLCGGH